MACVGLRCRLLGHPSKAELAKSAQQPAGVGSRKSFGHLLPGDRQLHACGDRTFGQSAEEAFRTIFLSQCSCRLAMHIRLAQTCLSSFSSWWISCRFCWSKPLCQLFAYFLEVVDMKVPAPQVSFVLDRN